MNKIYPHAKEESWWDGPERFKFINRCEVSRIQTETLMRTIKVLLGDNGIDVGGPTFGHILKSLNIIKGDGVDIIANGAKLPYDDESLDYIFSYHTLEHIPNTEQVLKEWLRVVKRGGYVIIVIPDKRYHLHDPNNTKLGEWAPEEKTPEELYGIIEKLNADILSFNTRNNNFDFEFLIKKEIIV